MTPIGRFNLLVSVAALGLVFLTATVPSFAQIVIRIFDDKYTTGLDQTVPLFALWIGMVILCMWTLAIIDRWFDNDEG